MSLPRRPSALYITYTGVLSPLGQSQVLAYQEQLAADFDVHILSFERKEDWGNYEERNRVTQRTERAGISWHPLPYHQRPSVAATAWDILSGIRKGHSIARTHRFEIIHARSYVSSVIALSLKSSLRAKYIFDMRGFWADERVDGGLWKRAGGLYRIAKRFEQQFLLQADHVVSLTSAAVREMKTFEYLQTRMPPMTVIPTCTDLNRFQPTLRPPPPLTVGYVGSAGTWYRFDAVAAAFRKLLTKAPTAKLLILNKDEHAHISHHLQSAGVPPDSVELRSTSHTEVPKQMARMHAGVFFITPAYSKLASAPTRLGEFLGCGIPCLSNAGVGDMAAVLEGDEVGVAIPSLDGDELERGLDRLLSLIDDPGIQKRCVESAKRHFSLEGGVSAYRDIYSSLLSDGEDRASGRGALHGTV